MQTKYNYNLEKVFEAKSLREFHDEYSVNIFKEKSTEDLFDKYLITPQHIKSINIPT